MINLISSFLGLNISGLTAVLFGTFLIAALGYLLGSVKIKGLSLGTAAHAMGTSRAMDVSDKYGAFASLGLTINGIFTALLTPTVLSLLD